MSLNRNLHIGLILVVIVASIAYGMALDWESIFEGSIILKDLQGFLTSVFVLLVLILGYFYKPVKAWLKYIKIENSLLYSKQGGYSILIKNSLSLLRGRNHLRTIDFCDVALFTVFGFVGKGSEFASKWNKLLGRFCKWLKPLAS